MATVSPAITLWRLEKEWTPRPGEYYVSYLAPTGTDLCFFLFLFDYFSPDSTPDFYSQTNHLITVYILPKWGPL